MQSIIIHNLNIVLGNVTVVVVTTGTAAQLHR